MKKKTSYIYKKGDIAKVIHKDVSRTDPKFDHLVKNGRKVLIDSYSSKGRVIGRLLNPKTNSPQKSLCPFHEWELEKIK